MVKVWAGAGSHRYRYIKRSLPSLLQSALPDGTRVIIVDDQSTDPRLASLLADLSNDARVEVWSNPERMGPNRGQEYNFPKVVERYPNAEVVMMCDDDLVYHPGWLQRILAVYSDAKQTGLEAVFSAFNVPIRPSYRTLRLATSEVLLKERQAALNWLIPRAVYDRVGPFKDVGMAYDTEYCNRLNQHGIPIACMRPSYVQNIGYHGAYQNSEEYTARDFVGSVDLSLRVRHRLYTARRSAVKLLDGMRRLSRSATL